MGNGFLRIKVEKIGLIGLIVFIAELVLSRQESVISMVVERASGESDHVVQYWSDYSRYGLVGTTWASVSQ